MSDKHEKARRVEGAQVDLKDGSAAEPGKKIEQAYRSDPMGAEEVLDQIEAAARGRAG